MKVLASLLAFAGLSITLLGCGGSETTPSPTDAPDPTPETTKDFQSLGPGACRAGANGDVTPPAADFKCTEVTGNDDAAKEADCRAKCLADATCKGFEFTPTRPANGTCTGAELCELHTKAVTGAEAADHDGFKCFRRVDILDFKKGGACRTADGKPGTFKCLALAPAECKANCLGDKTCTAYETTDTVDTTGECKAEEKCEIHTAEITKVDRDSSHSTHQCFAVNPVTKALSAKATYVV